MDNVTRWLAARRRWLALAAYAMALSLCIPTRVFSFGFFGQRQMLVPMATLLLALVWLAGYRGRIRFVSGQSSVVWACLVLFLGVVVVSSAANPNRGDSLSRVGVYAERMVMLFLLVQVMAADWRTLSNVTVVVAVGLAVVACLMLLGLLAEVGGRAQSVMAGRQDVLRVSAGLGDENLTAFAFNVGLALALGQLVMARQRMRIVLLVAVFLLVAGVARTVSIGGLVGLVCIVALAAAWLLPAVQQRRWLLAVVVAGLSVGLLAAAGTEYLARLQQQVVLGEASVGNLGTQRVNLILGGARMALTHPLFGVGPANVAANMPRYLPFPSAFPNQGAHDGFVSVAAESGLVSVLLLVLTALAGIRLFRSALRYCRKVGLSEHAVVGTSLGIALIASLVQTLAIGTQREPFMWLVVALALSFSLYVRRLRRMSETDGQKDLVRG